MSADSLTPACLDRLRRQALAFAAAAEVWAAASPAERSARRLELERLWADIGATLRRAGIPLAAGPGR